MFGCCAVVTTAMFQIWQGTKQKDYGLSGTQLQSGIAPWQSAQALVVAASTEFFCYGPKPCVTAIDFFNAWSDPAHMHTLWLVLGTCFLALLVNFCSFGLIGRTSPITFQVVGHLKTCLVLVGGYVLFPSKQQDTQQLYNNIAGVTVPPFAPAKPKVALGSLATDLCPRAHRLRRWPLSAASSTAMSNTRRGRARTTASTRAAPAVSWACSTRPNTVKRPRSSCRASR